MYTHTHVYTCIYVYMRIKTVSETRTQKNKTFHLMYRFLWENTRICMCVYTNIHTRIHTYTHRGVDA